MNRDEVVMALNLVATKAKLLSYQVENARTWDGDVNRGLKEIEQALEEARRNVRPTD